MDMDGCLLAIEEAWNHPLTTWSCHDQGLGKHILMLLCLPHDDLKVLSHCSEFLHFRKNRSDQMIAIFLSGKPDDDKVESQHNTTSPPPEFDCQTFREVLNKKGKILEDQYYWLCRYQHYRFFRVRDAVLHYIQAQTDIDEELYDYINDEICPKRTIVWGCIHHVFDISAGPVFTTSGQEDDFDYHVYMSDDDE